MGFLFSYYFFKMQSCPWSLSFTGLMISLFSNLEPGLLNESNQSALLYLSGSTNQSSWKNESKCLLPKIVSVLTLRTIRQFVSLRTGEGSHLRTWLRTLNLLFRIRQTSTFLEVSGWKRLIAPSPNLSNWTAKNSVFWKKNWIFYGLLS